MPERRQLAARAMFLEPAHAAAASRLAPDSAALPGACRPAPLPGSGGSDRDPLHYYREGLVSTVAVFQRADERRQLVMSRPEEAMRLARRAVKLTDGKDAAALEVAAAARAAIELYRRGLTLPTGGGPPAAAER